MEGVSQKKKKKKQKKRKKERKKKGVFLRASMEQWDKAIFVLFCGIYSMPIT